MAETKIEWADYTFNPWIGCAKVSEACRHCYAEEWARRYKREGLWGPTAGRARTTTWGDPRQWHRARLRRLEASAEYDPPDWPGPRPRVFCASLADAFEARDDLDPIRADLWTLIEECHGLDWLLLTKRPEEIQRRVPAAWRGPGGWPDHVWVGTTVENQEAAERRIPHLLGVPAPVRFLSVEPMLGPVDLGMVRDRPGILDGEGAPYFDALRGSTYWPDGEHGVAIQAVNWVICGGESGQRAGPMHPEWARNLRDQCVAAGVPFFFKQWGEYAPSPAGNHLAPMSLHGDTRLWRVGKAIAGRNLDGRTWDEVPRA